MSNQVSVDVDELARELEALETDTEVVPAHPGKLADSLEPVLSSYVLQYHTMVETARVQKDIGNDEEVARLIGMARPLLASIKGLRRRIEALRAEATPSDGVTLLS